MTALSAETRLVFRSADVTATPEELLAIAREVTDWERALRLAEAEAATASIWRALSPVRDALPAQVVEFLRTRTMMSDFRMQRLATRLSETLTEFRTRAVDVMLLKGAAIGARVDPSFRTRPMTDLDLLVRPEALPAAREALKAAGWQQSDDPRFHGLLAGAQHEVPFYDGNLPGQRLELHTRILPPDHSFRVSEQAMWEASRPAREPFAGAVVPSSVHMLFHLCVHFAWQHQMSFGSWRSIRAISALIESSSRILSLAVSSLVHFRAASSAYWTLRLAKSLAGLEVPHPVMLELQPPAPRWLARGVERSVIARIAAGEGLPAPSVRLAELLWRAAIRPHWSGHTAPRRWEESNRWVGHFATENEGTLVRLRRHVRNYQGWWKFLKQTVRE